MRKLLYCSVLGAALLAAPAAYAGNQKEEKLADGVRIALSNAIADARPPRPQFADINQRILYLRWLTEMSGEMFELANDV